MSAAFASGFVTLLIGAAVGIPGFLEHAHATSSLGIDAQLGKVFGDPGAGYSQGMSPGLCGTVAFHVPAAHPRKAGSRSI